MPVAASVKSGLPAAIVEGEIDVRANVGGAAPVIVRVAGPDVVVSDFIARRVTVPAVRIWAAETDMVS